MDGSWTFYTVPWSTCAAPQGADLLQQTSLMDPASSGLSRPRKSVAHQDIRPLFSPSLLIWCDLSLSLSCLFSPTRGYLQIHFTTGCQSVLSHIFVIAFVFMCNCQIKENSLHFSLEYFKILLFYYTYSIIFLLFGVILWYSALHLSVPHIPSFCVWPLNSNTDRGLRNRSTCAVHRSPWARLLPFMTW